MSKFNFLANVASEVFEAGRTEDGHPFIAERYYVEVSNGYGLRFRHSWTFSGVTPVTDEDGYTYYADHREQAQKRAQKLVDRVNHALSFGYVLSEDCWREDAPVYGSDHYINSGEEAQRAYADRLAA
jgi:hypothetical protein